MGTQTPYYHHIADAAWFGLYFSRCHSNSKPGSKSEYPLWCSTPPYGKIIVTVWKGWSVSPTPPSQLQFSRDPPETCHMSVRSPRRSQSSSIGHEGNAIFSVTSNHPYSLLRLLCLPWRVFRSESMFSVRGLSSAGF